MNEPVTFTAVVTGTEPITLTWDFGDGGTAQGLSVTHTFTETGSFTVTLTAENACGVTTVSHAVPVEDVQTPEWMIYLPIVVCPANTEP